MNMIDGRLHDMYCIRTWLQLIVHVHVHVHGLSLGSFVLQQMCNSENYAWNNAGRMLGEQLLLHDHSRRNERGGFALK